MTKDQCETYCDEQERVQYLRSAMDNEDFTGTAQLFKGLADPTRLKIAYALVKEVELCVCDVAAIIQSSVATASHHLRLLRNMGLAKSRRKGKLVYYSLEDNHVKQMVQLAMEHQKEIDSIL